MSVESSPKNCEATELCAYCPLKTLDAPLQIIGKEAVEWAIDEIKTPSQFDYVVARLREEYGSRQGGWTEVVRDCYILEVDKVRQKEA